MFVAGSSWLGPAAAASRPLRSRSEPLRADRGFVGRLRSGYECKRSKLIARDLQFMVPAIYYCKPEWTAPIRQVSGEDSLHKA